MLDQIPMLKENGNYMWLFAVFVIYFASVMIILAMNKQERYMFMSIAVFQSVIIFVEVRSGIALNGKWRAEFVKGKNSTAYRNTILLQSLILAFAWLLSIGLILGNWR